MPKCSRCGADLPEGAVVCSNCGMTLESPPPPPPGPISRERSERYEKGEKGEKGEKHEKEEKGEKHEVDRFGPIVGGLILILLGSLFYLSMTNVISWSRFGGYFMIGIGLILIIWAVMRYVSMAFKGPALGLLIGGLILAFLGFSTVLEIQNNGALILIGIGLIVIIWSIVAFRRSPRPR